MTTPTGSYAATQSAVFDESVLAKLGLISVQKTIERNHPENNRWTSSFQIGNEEYVVQGFAADFGRPRGIDNDIYMALQTLYVGAGCPPDGVVRVTPYELIRMVHCTPSAALYERTRLSLMRLWRVGFVVHHATLKEGSPWREYLSKTVNLLSLEKSLFGLDVESAVLMPHKEIVVTFSEPVRNSLMAGYTHYLDWKVFKLITHPTGRAIHRILSAHRPSNDELEVRLSDWAAQCGILSDRPSKVLQTLAQAHTELVKVGYLESVTVTGRGKHQSITYVYKAPEEEAPRADPALVALLTDLGVKKKTAQGYVLKYGPLVEQAAALARKQTAQQAETSRPVRNPGGLVVSILKDPERFQFAVEPEVTVASTAVRAQAASEVIAAAEREFEQSKAALAQADFEQQWDRTHKSIRMMAGRHLSPRGWENLERDCRAGVTSALEVSEELARRPGIVQKQEYLSQWEPVHQPYLLSN